jgi:DNA-binding NarL/FixJ family response regulator
MRVLIADKDPRVRRAMSMLLKFESEMSIVGESADASSLLDLAREVQPDVILLDWELADGSVSELVGHLKEGEPPCRVLVLARRPEVQQAALALGADAFVSKTDPVDSLLATLKQFLEPQERDSVAV